MDKTSYELMGRLVHPPKAEASIKSYSFVILSKIPKRIHVLTPVSNLRVIERKTLDGFANLSSFHYMENIP